MKFIFLALFVIPFSVFGQQLQVIISANNKSINASPGDDNRNKLLTLNSSSFTGNNLLTIYIEKDEAAKDWKRSFAVYDSTGNALKDFVFMKDGSYCIKLAELITFIKPQQEYFIYAMSIPADRQKAMLVKIAKQLLCRIKIL